MINPDKHIRKYFATTLNGQIVDGKVITVHDYRSPFNSDAYILMINQSMTPNRDNKCDIVSWNCFIVLDVVTVFSNISGSRLLADNIKEMVMNETQSISIDNFSVDNVNITYPDDLSLITSTQTIFRKLINYEFKLTQL
jgi:hypothetical protein